MAGRKVKLNLDDLITSEGVLKENWEAVVRSWISILRGLGVHRREGIDRVAELLKERKDVSQETCRKVLTCIHNSWNKVSPADLFYNTYFQ